MVKFSVFWVVPGDGSTLLFKEMPPGTPVPRIGDILHLPMDEGTFVPEDWEVIKVTHNWTDLDAPRVSIDVQKPKKAHPAIAAPLDFLRPKSKRR